MGDESRVVIFPMSQSVRDIPRRWRPCHPPIFPYGDPTPEDRALAAALAAELDEESRAWWGFSD